MTLWLLLLALPLSGALVVIAGALLWQRRVPPLTAVDPVAPPGGWPLLSVIAPCRDEADGVERAARSLLAQDYPSLEVVFVDDRSTDGTGALLDALRDPRLTVVHVAELPDDWLGKSHACERGAREARGAWLLFTDGDVVFEPTALRRAIAYAERHGLGHLVVLPHMDAPGFLERAFVSTFGVAALLKFRPWELWWPRTPAHIGVGACNLVRTGAWRAIGGHGAVAYEVVDDVKLGLVLRRSGVAQGAIDSGGLVHLRWNAGARATLRGLVKNAFASAEYRWSATFLGAAVVVVSVVTPWLALAVAPPVARAMAALSTGVTLLVHVFAARRMAHGTGLEGLLQPVTQLCLAFVLLWSALSATLRGGVSWRGTFYPLPVLRARCVRERAFPLARVVGWTP